MMLYWGMFTLGFFAGTILVFITFAPKNPAQDPEYEPLQPLPIPNLSQKRLYRSNYRQVKLNSPFPKKLFEKQVLYNQNKSNKSDRIPEIDSKRFGVN